MRTLLFATYFLDSFHIYNDSYFSQVISVLLGGPQALFLNLPPLGPLGLPSSISDHRSHTAVHSIYKLFGLIIWAKFAFISKYVVHCLVSVLQGNS